MLEDEIDRREKTHSAEMARVRPSSLDEMREISGVGPRKLAQFGDAFLQVTRGNIADTQP